MTTLNTRLDAIKKAFAAKVPDDIKAVMHGATQAVIDSGQAERAHGAGATMPAFALPNTSGRMVESSALLARGPLVLTFFRGHW